MRYFAGILVVSPAMEDDEFTGGQSYDIELEGFCTLFDAKSEGVEGVLHSVVDSSTVGVDYR